MKGWYEVNLALMRGTIRLITGRCTRRELRKSMLTWGWTEPNLSDYLDMVSRAKRQIVQGDK